MPELLRPRALAPGDRIGICAPAGPVTAPECLAQSRAWFERQGVETCAAPNLLARRGYLAGDDRQRLEDFMGLVRDPGVGLVLAARGGYGIGRWLSRADAAELRAARKLVVGYSDVTLLLSFLRERAGLASIHGPMLERDDTPEPARARLLALARGEPVEPLAGKSVRGGVARGPLVGGSLKMLASALATASEPSTHGAILFLEDTGEQPYSLDRALVQLRDAGKLAGVAGVALGQFVSCESAKYPETSARDALLDVLTDAFEGPIVEDLGFGHVADNRALGVGVEAELDADTGTLRMLEPVVERES